VAAGAAAADVAAAGAAAADGVAEQGRETIMRRNSYRHVAVVRTLAALVATAWLGADALVPHAASQHTFDSAEAAVSALVEAAKDHDQATLLAIFGPEGKAVIASGDPVADQQARERFVERAGEGTHVTYVGDDFAVLSAGADDWPLPIPLVKESGAWRFDTAAGKTEILNRRIGRNELFTIAVCEQYVDAQRDYARRIKAAGGEPEYAQGLRSTPGTRDGLYWETASDEDESPMGPLVASAAREGYGLKRGAGALDPFHGYLYRILKAQGPQAPGGKKSYLRDGRMTEGFALVAYPAEYGSSGIMTFVVNQQGVVFQKDLGRRTAEIAGAMTAYDPDDSWDPAD
jgi:hypothetical protein